MEQPIAQSPPLVALVTGGGSGIGAALCRRLAAPGRIVAVHTGRNRANAEAVAAELVAAGATAVPLVRDLAQPGAGAAVVAEVAARWGRLDHLVHVAGRADRRAVGALDTAGWQAALALNATAFLELATAALPLLRASGRGRVVAVGSFLATVFRLGEDMHFPATAASKAALAALARSLAMQLAPEGVTVNLVVPGFIEKDAGAHAALDPAARARAAALVPMRRYGTADEAAAAAAFLLSADASYVTGQCLHVDGGLSL